MSKKQEAFDAIVRQFVGDCGEVAWEYVQGRVLHGTRIEDLGRAQSLVSMWIQSYYEITNRYREARSAPLLTPPREWNDIRRQIEREMDAQHPRTERQIHARRTIDSIEIQVTEHREGVSPQRAGFAYRPSSSCFELSEGLPHPDNNPDFAPTPEPDEDEVCAVFAKVVFAEPSEWVEVPT